MGTIGILLTITSVVFSFILLPSIIFFQLVGSKKLKEHKQIITSMIKFKEEKDLLSNYNLLFAELQKAKLDDEKINSYINLIKSKLLNSREKSKLKNLFVFNKNILIGQLGNSKKINHYFDIQLTKNINFGDLKNINLWRDQKFFKMRNTENVKIALLLILILYVSEPTFIGYLKHNAKYDYIFNEFKYLSDSKNSFKLMRAKYGILKYISNAKKDKKDYNINGINIHSNKPQKKSKVNTPLPQVKIPKNKSKKNIKVDSFDKIKQNKTKNSFNKKNEVKQNKTKVSFDKKNKIKQNKTKVSFDKNVKVKKGKNMIKKNKNNTNLNTNSNGLTEQEVMLNFMKNSSLKDASKKDKKRQEVDTYKNSISTSSKQKVSIKKLDKSRKSGNSKETATAGPSKEQILLKMVKDKEKKSK